MGVTASHESPESLLSVQGDLFAFGCVLYEIMTKQVPHDGKTDDEIRGLYTSGVFPDTSSLGAVGRIVRKCWLGKCLESKALVRDLKGMSPNSQRQLPEPLIPSSPTTELHRGSSAHLHRHHRDGRLRLFEMVSTSPLSFAICPLRCLRSSIWDTLRVLSSTPFGLFRHSTP